MRHVNVEIKAICRDPDAVRRVLRAQGARFVGTDPQIDTYFRIDRGRLKLREGRIENCLIYYEREDVAGPKRADVTLFKTESGSGLKEILTRSLGVLTVVVKRREIYFIDNVKFHIDTVDGLGTFVEIEAIDQDATATTEHLAEQCRAYKEMFGICDDDLVSQSYSDMAGV